MSATSTRFTRPVVLHVGLQKTATTALQRAYFPSLGGIDVLLARGGPDFDARLRALTDGLRTTDDGGAALVAHLEAVAGRASKPLLISDEGLCGTHWRPRSCGLHVADLLAGVFSRPRVLVMVREQGAMLRSIYGSYVQKGGTRAFRRFVEQAGPQHTLHLEHLAYDTLVAGYQDRFGADRVKVVAYERLLDDATGTLGEIASFVGAEATGPAPQLEVMNRSLSPISRRILILTNRLFVRSASNPRPPLPWPAVRRVRSLLQDRIDPLLFSRAKRRLSRADETFLDTLVDRYRESNRRLMHLTGLPLGRLGYRLPPNGADSPTG